MFNLFSKKGGSDAPAKARSIENQRQKTINSAIGNTLKTFSTMGDSYYNTRAKEYVNFAMPRVAEKLRAGQRAMIYNYADRGLSKSSAASAAQERFNNAATDARADVIDQGEEVAQAARNEDLARQQQLIAQIVAAQNPQIAKEQTLLGTSQIQMPDSSMYLVQALNNMMKMGAGAQYFGSK